MSRAARGHQLVAVKKPTVLRRSPCAGLLPWRVRYDLHLGDGGGWLTGSSSFQPRRAVGIVFGAK
jgi:hypothetical protein